MKKPQVKPDEVPRLRAGYFKKELKPCPFCGKNPHVIAEKAPPLLGDFIGVVMHIQCQGHTKCVVCPSLNMRRGKKVVTSSPLGKLDTDWLRHRFENQLWRKMR